MTATFYKVALQSPFIFFGVRWLDTALDRAGGAPPLRLLRLFVANLEPRKSQNARKAGVGFLCANKWIWSVLSFAVAEIRLVLQSYVL